MSESPAAGPDARATWLIVDIDIRGTLRTNDEVVRRELLFAVGDTIAAARVDETERNLRRLLFLGQVSLHLEPSDDTLIDPGDRQGPTGSAFRVGVPRDSDGVEFTGVDSTDVESVGVPTPTPARAIVEVQERYARALSPLLEGGTRELSFGLVALDYNFLGRGQVAQVTIFHDAVGGNEVLGRYQHTRWRGTRQALHLEVGYAGNEGHDLALSLAQPFYSLDTPTAFGASLFINQQRQRLYRNSDLAARYDDHLAGARLWLVHSFDHHGLKVRPGLRLSLSDRAFDADVPFTYEPIGRRRVIPSLSLTLWRPRYARERFVRDLGQIEDLQIGSWLSTQVGLSTRALGSDRNYPVAVLQLAPRAQPTRNSFLFGLLSVSSRWRDSRPWHTILGASASGYMRVGGTHVIAARIAAHALHRLEDSGSQLLLGIGEGLRGYRPRRFDGTRRVLANLEARPVLRQRQPYVLGVTLFADIGSAWTPGREQRHWGSAIGAGLRLGLPTVYDAPILRIDIARGYGSDAESMQLSFGLGHAF